MELSIWDRVISILTPDSETLNTLDKKDGIGTLPGTGPQFRINENGLIQILSEAEVKAIRNPSASAFDASPTSSAPAAVDAPAASQTPSEGELFAVDEDVEFPRRLREGLTETVPSKGVPCSTSQTCGQMDCSENRKFSSQAGSQQHRGSVTRGIPDDCRNRGNSRNNASSGCQVNEADRRAKRVRKKRKLLLESDDEDKNADEEKNKSNNMKSRRNTKPIKQAVPAKKKAWNWVSYLEEERMPAAPIKLFREHQSFPQGRNGFKIGMKLEGLDPENPSRFCVLTVAEVHGYRIRLHFDSYPDCYDFWVNADSSDIYPVGWCEKTSHKLLPPKGFKEGEFNWTCYLKNCKAQAAPKTLFKTLSTPVTPSGFRLGMKLEAVDKKNPSMMCVATVTDMVDNRLLIHFDNWDETYDYWCDASSPYIRPIGYCQETGTPLTPPPGYEDSKAFSWEKYLEETNSQAAPARAFKLRPAHGFQVNTKLEAVDRRNPILIRVATIVDKDDHRIKIHFDGWDHNYDFWVDADSPDVHPIGWCAKTGHALQVPLGAVDRVGPAGQACPTRGCLGIGHVRGPRYGTHYTLVGCPYSDVNFNRESLLQDRLGRERPFPSNPMQNAKRLETPAPFFLGAGDSSQKGSAQSRLECSHAYINFQLAKQRSNGKDPSFDLQHALHQSIFMPSLASNPTHRLHLRWEQHCKLLPEVSGLTTRHVAKWSVEEVVSFVQRLLGCKEQASVFREEEIDGEAFLLLNQNDIVKILGIKLGPALKIYNAILMFKSAEDI